MPIPSVAYVTEFQEKLGDAVSQALGFDNPILGGLKASALYDLELQISAASAGHALQLPHEAAIAYFVLGEGIRFERSINRLSLVFSRKKRETYGAHRKIIGFVRPILDAASDKSVSEKFFSLMTEDVKRMNQRAEA